MESQGGKNCRNMSKMFDDGQDFCYTIKGEGINIVTDRLGNFDKLMLLLYRKEVSWNKYY